MKKIAVICNHNYVDMLELFRHKARLKESELSDSLIFLKNSNAEKIEGTSRVPSSFSKSPFLDVRVFFDCLWSPILFIYLFFSGVRYIHFTTSHFSNLPLATLGFFFRVKLIFTIHRFDLDSYDPVRRCLLVAYEKYLKLIAYRIVVLSDTNRIPDELKEVIPLSGFKQYRFKPKSTGEYTLFFGRIDDYKGLEDLYELAVALPNNKFVVAGSGSHSYLGRLSALDNVQVLNRFILESEVPMLFDGANSVLLPYKSATQSGVQMLAYSFATPVVVYDVGNLSQFIGKELKTGWLVEKSDVPAMVEILKQLSSEQLFEMSSACISYFEQNFSDKVMVAQYQEFYSSILNKGCNNV